MQHINILYIDGCPNQASAVELAKYVADRSGMETEINEIKIHGPEDVQRYRFLGSPSIRVNGIDIEPMACDRSDFGLSCRTYSGKGLPTPEMLAVALRGHVTKPAVSAIRVKHAGS